MGKCTAACPQQRSINRFPIFYGECRRFWQNGCLIDDDGVFFYTASLSLSAHFYVAFSILQPIRFRGKQKKKRSRERFMGFGIIKLNGRV